MKKKITKKWTTTLATGCCNRNYKHKHKIIEVNKYSPVVLYKGYTVPRELVGGDK